MSGLFNCLPGFYWCAVLLAREKLSFAAKLLTSESLLWWKKSS